MQLFKLKCDDFLERDADGNYYMPAEQQVRDEAEKTHWKEVGFTLLKDWRLYLMLVPMIIVYLLWRYMPMTELLSAFKDQNTPGAAGDSSMYDWYGLTNFDALFFGAQSSMFWAAFKNTFVIAFYGLLFGFPFPIILALFFNEVKSNITRSILQVCVYLPKFMSTVIITTLFIVLFRGPLDPTVNAEEGLGLVTQLLLAIFPNNEQLYNAATSSTGGLVLSNEYFRALYQISGIWEHGGYDSIVFFAAVIAVSPTSYEAAQIDGAGKMQQMRYVVLPSILSTVVIMLIMKVGTLLSVGYERVLLLYNSNIYVTADVLSTFEQRIGILGGNYGVGAADSLFNSLIAFALVLGANTISRNISKTSLW